MACKQTVTDVPQTTDAAAQRLQRDVVMLAEKLSPRDAAHPRQLRAAREYIARAFQAAGLVPDIHVIATAPDYANVVAAMGPPAAPRLIIGAHYDAAGPYPGADDNASGVAGVLELARRLARETFKLRVEFVAFCLEEPPHFGLETMGSHAYAQRLRAAGAKVQAMLSLEMIGYFNDADGSQQYPHPAFKALYPNRGNFIAVVGRWQETALVRRIVRAMRGATPLSVQAFNGPASTPGLALSDHASFWAAGYKAAMVTDTAFLRNPHYHTAGDTPATLDYTRMAQVIDGLAAAIVATAR